MEGMDKHAIGRKKGCNIVRIWSPKWLSAAAELLLVGQHAGQRRQQGQIRAAEDSQSGCLFSSWPAL